MYNHYNIEDINEFINKHLELGYSPMKIYKDVMDSFIFKNKEHRIQIMNYVKKFLDIL